MILYHDTRALIDRPRTFCEVILEGIAPGGGLFVPERLPHLTVPEIVALAALPYHERAAVVYEAFGLDVSAARVSAIAAAAYAGNFNDSGVAPVREVAPGRFVLELWHGPTLAFKDMALQCMPLFFREALEQAHAREGDERRLPRPRGDVGRHGCGRAQRLRRSLRTPASPCTTPTPACRRCRNAR